MGEDEIGPGDDACFDCGHAVDGCHDPAGVCLHPECDGKDDAPCDIRYDEAGRLARV